MSQEDYRIRSIVVEGGDQVGKGDASKELANELCSNGEEVIIVSLPVYATPSGTAIRELLSSGYKEFEKIPEVKDSIGTVKQTECVMALFALNRLEALSCLTKIANEGKLLLFDRSPYSHALTISYNIASGSAREDDIEYLVNKGFWMDSHFVESLNLKNCVLQLHRNNSEWKPIRKEGKGDDKYETKEVQDICDKVFERFEDIVGPGWKNIVTRAENQWRNREDIKGEIMKFVRQRMDIESTNKHGNIRVPTLEEYIGHIYPGIQPNPSIVNQWEESLAMNDKPSMYASAVQIGYAIGSQVKDIVFEPEIIKSMKIILDEYPECYAILSYFFGDKYVAKLVKIINGQKRIS